MLLALEERRLLATLTVTNTDASGSGSLAAVIGEADTNYQANTIVFEQSAFSTHHTISLGGSQLRLSDASGTQTITGPAAGVTISGGGESPVIQVGGGVTTTLSGLTLSGGSIAGDGGGLYNAGTATLTDCTISANSAENGGGLWNYGTATLDDCTISGNSAPRGGGILSAGTLTLTDCTLSGNSALYGGGSYTGGQTTLTDCTVSGNTASGLSGVGQSAGGLTNTGPITLTACTISGNTGSFGGGLVTVSMTTLTDTIVVGNSGRYDDIVAANNTVTGNNNLVGTASSLSDPGGSIGITNGQGGNLVGVTNPGLGTLGNFGGQTQTIPLLPGSLAIGAGEAVSGLTTDQRGEPLGSPQPDIGAFQSQGFTLTVVAGDSPQSATTGAPFAEPLGVTVTARNAIEPVAGGVLTFTAPSSGASARLSSGTSTIGSNGVASVTATANSIPGSYSVTASAAGSVSSVAFALTNNGPTATFLGQDTTTQGTWIHTYGTQGYDVIGSSTSLSLPSYATITPSGESSYTWASTTTDPRALQVADGAGRIAAAWYAATSFTVDVNLTDSQQHDLELYFLDWDKQGRSEQVKITNAVTGAVLSTQTISSFQSGTYLDYAISGNVLITFTKEAGQNAVLSGLFLDSPAGPSATFLKQDTTTQGTWINTYGAQGYDVIGSSTSVSLPSYATVTPAGQSSYTWASSTTDPRALQVAGGSSRIAATWYASTSFTVDVDLSDGQQHDLELYFLDWDKQGRSEQVQITSAATGAVLSTQTVSSFQSGIYLDYTVSGNVLITFTREAGQNAVLSGLFLGSAPTPTPTPTATFLKQDTTTQGTWIHTYGTQGYDVIGSSTSLSLPSYATITPSGESSYTWASTTTDPRALQVADGASRIAAAWYASTSFTVDVDLSDGQQHDLELYFLDWDKQGRSEQIQISSAATGAVLSTQTVSSFQSGTYLDYAISGNVLITFTKLSGPNAVLSGLFLDPTTTATYLKQDTTQGTGIGSYGIQAFDVIGGIASLPADDTATPEGQFDLDLDDQ